MFSIWEQQEFLKADYIIVGSGITGLSCALSVRKYKPSARIVVLERGILPAGASTKNAGFACIGSYTEKVADRKQLGDDVFLSLIEKRIKGLERLRKELGEATIDFQQHGGYDLILDHMDSIPEDAIEDMNKLLMPLLKSRVFTFQNTHLVSFGFRGVKQLICNTYEGQLNTGKLMSTLLQLCATNHITLYTGAKVDSYVETATHVALEVKNNVSHTVNPLHFYAEQVIFCTNAFLPEFFPDMDVKPGRGQVLSTHPVENLPWKGVFSMEEGYYYFRNFGNRIVFGGGRNRDFEGENTTHFGTTSTILSSLHTYLQDVILPNQPVSIEYTWSGIMAFGAQKIPLIKRHSSRVIAGGRLNGMGIAIGMEVGEELALLAIN